MAAPSYRCPFKVNPATNQGIACENTACGAYDGVKEHCDILLVIKHISTIYHTTEVPNNA